MRRRSTFSVISQCTINMPAHIRRVTWKRYHDVNAWQPDGLQRWEQIPRDSLWLSGKQKGQGLQQNRGRNVVNTCSKLAIADSDKATRYTKQIRCSLGPFIIWQFSLAWNTTKSSLLTLLYPFPAHVFSVSLPGPLSYPQWKPVWSNGVLLFWLFSSQIPGTHSSLTHYRGELPFSYSFTKKEKKREKERITGPPTPLLFRNQTHSPSCTRNN